MIQYHLEPSLSPLGELCLWIWPHSLHFCRATFLHFLHFSILLVSSCFFLVVRVGKFLGSTWSEAGWVPSSVHKKLATWRSSLKFHPPSIAHLQRCPPVSPPPCRDFMEKVDLKKIKDMKTTKENFLNVQGVKNPMTSDSLGSCNLSNLTNWSSSKMYVRYGLICFFNLTVLLLRVNAPKAVLRRCQWQSTKNFVVNLDDWISQHHQPVQPGLLVIYQFTQDGPKKTIPDSESS